MGNKCCCCSRSSSGQRFVPDTSYRVPIQTSPEFLSFRERSSVVSSVPTMPAQSSTRKRKIVIALYNYEAKDSQDLSFVKGDRMEIQDASEGEWLYVKHLGSGDDGYVPGNFVAEELSIESEDWFFDKISRKEAETLLGNAHEPRGTFLVRPAEHSPNGYSLSIKDWDETRGYHIKHYKIKLTENGVFFISNNKVFSSLPALISEYSKNAYGICHILSKPCHKPKPTMYDLGSTYKDKWEIPRDEIQLLRKLGKGNFGEVYYGKWKNQYEVAVKMLRQGTMTSQAFLQEASIMKNFRHKRLVQLYGVCSSTEPIYIIQEYMEKGSLLEFLQNDQGKTLRFDDQIFIAYQVASGMAHLEAHNFIHRDLAARNVLLRENNVAKICDFGLARFVENEIYAAHGGKFPVKWTAPEALLNSVFTTKSDVWSYGIFLMELFTFGVAPYEGMRAPLVIELVTSGYRMKKPENLPDEIYEKMMRCWHEVPDRRPTFKSLEQYFESMDVIYRDRDLNSGGGIILNHNIPKFYEDHEVSKVSKIQLSEQV